MTKRHIEQKEKIYVIVKKDVLVNNLFDRAAETSPGIPIDQQIRPMTMMTSNDNTFICSMLRFEMQQ